MLSDDESKAAKLKEIALSTGNTYMERLRAIDLLGHLKEDMFDELLDIASNGLSRSERMGALEMLGRAVKKVHGEAKLDTKPVEIPVKPAVKIAKPTNGKLTDELFNEMLRHVKPLLAHSAGCDESQIKKQFRNLKGSVVETFLTRAIGKGIVKEIMPGTFKLTGTK